MRAAILIAAAWRASVDETARAYRLRAQVLSRPLGNGRGFQSPPIYSEARKLAIYVAVMVADCDYAALARTIGLHRDTVTGHCAQMRERVIEDQMLARRAGVLERKVRLRMGPEVAALFEQLSRDLSHQFDLMGLAEPAGFVEMRDAAMKRIAALTPYWRGVPTGFGAPNLAHENVISFQSDAWE